MSMDRRVFLETLLGTGAAVSAGSAAAESVRARAGAARGNVADILDPAGLPPGLSTGFDVLDDITGGLRPGLTIVGGRPSMGKTGFALALAGHAAVELRVPVLYLTLYESAAEIARLLACSRARVRPFAQRHGRLTPDERVRFAAQAERLGRSPLRIEGDWQPSAEKVVARVREVRAERGLALVVIDYYQLMWPGNDWPRASRRDVEEMTQALRGASMDLNVPLVLLSQLTRAPEDRGDHRPRPSDVAASRVVVPHADLLMLLYRDDYYRAPGKHEGGTCEVAVERNLNGPTGGAVLAFDRETMRFDPIGPVEWRGEGHDAANGG